MFFAEVLGAAPVPAGGLAARVAFRGSPSGAFTIAIDSSAARSLAAGFLAAEETELSPTRTGEVVCELANMICGSVLSRLEPDAAFELLHPELTAPGPSGAVSRSLDLGAGALAVSIDFHPGEHQSPV
jgi:CheY-specific phosphatase CheX